MKETIWVIPPEPTFSELEGTIDRLSHEHNTPSFRPHMTLLGGIEEDLSTVENKLRALANKFNQLDLSLGPVSFSTTFFQSVFIRVNSNAKLMKMNLEMKKIFDKENDVFMPHISLMYGVYDMDLREKIASEVRIQPASFTINELVLIAAASDDPKDWRQAAKIPLGK